MRTLTRGILYVGLLALVGCSFGEYLAAGGASSLQPGLPDGSGPAGVPQGESEWLGYALQWGVWVVGSAAAYIAGDRRGQQKGRATVTDG